MANFNFKLPVDPDWTHWRVADFTPTPAAVSRYIVGGSLMIITRDLIKTLVLDMKGIIDSDRWRRRATVTKLGLGHGIVTTGTAADMYASMPVVWMFTVFFGRIISILLLLLAGFYFFVDSPMHLKFWAMPLAIISATLALACTVFLVRRRANAPDTGTTADSEPRDSESSQGSHLRVTTT